MALNKKWVYRQPDQQAAGDLAKAADITELTAGILLARGIGQPEAARVFLGETDRPGHDPFLLKDMDKAVTRLIAALNAREKVCVYGDYDVDGITAAALFYRFFRELSLEIDYYIPERQAEGYGLNNEALKQIAGRGATLVITVDCGISSADEVHNAPPGLDIIITDHHTPPALLPKAYAVINPKQPDCPYPYKELSGVGVALKICQGIGQRLKMDDHWPAGAQLAALGTIADIVPLTGENREIAKAGIAAICSAPCLGLEQLIEVAGLTGRRIDAQAIAFRLAPRLNAAGRLSSARLGVDLLITRNKDYAAQLAAQLESENTQRQEIEKQILTQAEILIKQQGGVQNVILLARQDWHAGVIGIVASRLVERYNRPTVLISLSGELGKGSCRSISAFNMYEALSAAREHLLQYGGHRQAAGFSVTKEQIPLLYRSLLEYAGNTLCAEDYLPVQTVDISPADFAPINQRFMRELSLMEPFGAGNPAPVLAVAGVEPKNIAAFGQDSQHLKFDALLNGLRFPAVIWRGGNYREYLARSGKIQLAFRPEEQSWRDNKFIRLNTVDLKTEQIVFDLRDGNAGQNAYLAALAEQADLFIYCHDREYGATVCKNLPPEKITVGELPVSQAADAVFLQPPVQVWDDREFWRDLKKHGVKRVHLLYNANDIRQIADKSAQAIPSPDFLRQIYRFIRTAGQISAEELCDRFFTNKPALINGLAILKAISALQEKNDLLAIKPLAPGAKLDLAGAPSYQQLRQRHSQTLAALDKCLYAPSGEIAAFLGDKD